MTDTALDERSRPMTQTDKILSRKEGGVGYLTFNNPARHNAMSLDMWEKAGQVMNDFATDDSIRVVILAGAGGKAFVSGADISRFADERANEAAQVKYNKTVETTSAAIYDYPKPTISLIRGYCIGGGLGLAICTDLRICSDVSRFAVPAAKLGLGYAYTGIKRMTDLVGPSYTKEVFYTARQFSAAEAHSMGLVNRVLPDAEVEDYVKSYAETIAGNAPLTIAAVKYTVNETQKDSGKRDLQRSADMVMKCFGSKDFIEGRTAFMEKRKPAFTGT
jgi:enoyl-CoA hydratase/carnithine racemase